jgi:hypothetical protein
VLWDGAVHELDRQDEGRYGGVVHYKMTIIETGAVGWCSTRA